MKDKNYFVYSTRSSSIESISKETADKNIIYTMMSKTRTDLNKDKIPITFDLYEQIVKVLNSKKQEEEMKKQEHGLKKLDSKKIDIKKQEKDLKKQEKDLKKKIKAICQHLKTTIKLDSFKIDNYFYSDNLNFKLTYQSMLYIVDLINQIIDFIMNEKHKMRNFYSCTNEKMLIDFANKLINSNISKDLEVFTTVKTIHFISSSEEEKFSENAKINKHALVFFMLFYKQIFTSVVELDCDLNIYQLSNEYIRYNNPYNITADEIVKKGDLYHDNFIFNYIILNNLLSLENVMRVSISLYDSYQLEIHNIFSQAFFKKKQSTQLSKSSSNLREQNRTYTMYNKNTNDKEKIENKSTLLEKSMFSTSSEFLSLSNNIEDDILENILVYFLPLINFKEILNLNPSFYDYKFTFNSLDPLLFSTINQIIYTNKNLYNLKLSLFPDSSSSFLRKTLINQVYYDYYELSKDPDDKEEDTMFDIRKLKLNNLPKEPKDMHYIKEEIILDKLFTNFSKNLSELTVLLLNKITDLDSLYLDLSNHSNSCYDIEKYDNYNCSIICFVVNIFKEIHKLGSTLKLNQLEIILDDYNDGNIYIINHLNKKNKEIARELNNRITTQFENGIDLKNTKITLLHFSIQNISKIIPFDKFPCKTLQSLKLSRISYDDFKSLTDKIMKNKKMFPSLEMLEISFEFMIIDALPLIVKFLKYCIVDSLENVTIDFCKSFSFEDINSVIKAIHSYKSKNEKVKFVLNLHNDELYQELKKPIVRTVVLDKLVNVLKRDLYITHKQQTFKSFDLQLEKLNKGKINNYLSIIYCLDMIGNIKNETSRLKNNICNIYKKICYLLGNLKTKTWVKIKII